MGTVTISANNYTIYGTQAAAIVHLTASLGTAAEAFIGATSANQAKALVTATRMIDSVAWDGDPVVEGQAQAFPRTGLTDRDGNEVSSASVPTQVETATYELAAILIEDPDVRNETSGTNVKRVKAGPAEAEFFRPIRGTRFPRVVWELLVPFAAGGGTSAEAMSYATGTDVESSFDTDDEYTLAEGL